MSGFSALVPILNRRVATFAGPVWYLAPNASVKTIAEAHFSAAHKFGDHLVKSIAIDTKCIEFTGYSAAPTTDELRKLVLCSCYALTHFAREIPPALRFSFVVANKAANSKVVALTDVPETVSGAQLQGDNYKVKENCKSEEVAALFDICASAYSKHPAIETTIERYFSGRAKRMFQDKVIDTAIALETLIPGSVELKYRFSLYNSLISTEIAERDDAFRLFSLLYDARSAIVHGEAVKAAKLTELQNNWDTVLRYMDKALFYYLVFLKERDPQDWQNHLKRLALGHPEKISGEELQQ